MRSRLLLNLVLLLVVIGLAIVVLNTSSEQDKNPITRLTDLSAEEVTRIELHRQNEQPVSLYREQDVWYMAEPYQLAANDYRVQALLRLLQTEYRSRHNIGDRDPARYGLANPRSTVVFNDKLKIEFGNTEPLSKQRYLRIDDQLYLVSDTHYYHTVSPATGYLSYALLPPGKITALELPELQLSLEQGQWHSDPPHEAHSADDFTELVANWRSAQALRLEPYKQERLPNANIEVQLEGRESPVRFTLQEQDGQPGLLRQDARMRYVINDEIRQQLLQLPEPLPEPQLKTEN